MKNRTKKYRNITATVIVILTLLFAIVDNEKIRKYVCDRLFLTVVKTMLPYEKIRVITNTIEVEKKETIIDTVSGLVNRDNLLDYNYVLKNFYVVQGTTSLSEEKLNLKEISECDLTFERDRNVPQILILHTHGQEHFADYNENPKTIVDVGSHLKDILELQYGYNVMHITDSFDMVDGVLDRDKAYDYSNAKIDEILSEYPSIKVVIDLHRDGVDEDRHLVTYINDKQTAKIMLFNGISYSNDKGELTDLPNPYIKENLAMTYKMFLLGKMYYPDLFRCIYISDYRFGFYHVPRSMLIEAGAQTNTYAEVCNAMEPLAQLLVRTITCE